MMIQKGADRYQEVVDLMPAARGSVGVLSTTATGLHEVICLLARQEVGVARALITGMSEQAGEVDAAAMAAGLRSLQTDPTTEIVVLVSQGLAASATGTILDRVRASDKPTVVCFVGNHPHLAWRAGAIPAGRLDEAAMRATAWVRGWDQALVSSRLEEEADELSRLAASLRNRIGPGRREIRGVLTGSVLRQEAQFMLSTLAAAASAPNVLHIAHNPTSRSYHLNVALADPVVALILLTLWADSLSDPEPAGAVADLLQEYKRRDKTPSGPDRSGPLIVAHVCGTGCSLQQLAEQEARLRDTGVIVATSSASAALLAGLVVREME
jgi:FdrA protein